MGLTLVDFVMGVMDTSALLMRFDWIQLGLKIWINYSLPLCLTYALAIGPQILLSFLHFTRVDNEWIVAAGCNQ